jgi:multidrug efflux pump subunit AcrA (membrane-fusion protein)
LAWRNSNASDGELEIEADVPESDIVEIKVGQKAEITMDALSSEESLTAEVSDIEPSSTVIQDVVYYKVTLKLLDQDNRLKNGMSADIDIHTFEKNDVVTIPERSIKTDGGKKFVELLKTGNIVEKRYVETGIKGDEGMIEIKSGLSGSEEIITLTKSQ